MWRMKNLSAIISVACLLLCGCITKVMVDSPEHPIATYDDVTYDFTGKITGSLANAFKSTNIALERDMGFFRCGQVPKDKGWFIYARAKRDIKVVVNLKENSEKPNTVDVTISYGEDDLVTCQKIFKAILNNMKAYNK